MRLTAELQRWQDQIEEYAREYGLDFYKTIFEILSYDELNEVASFGGFPTRYPHWRFGMAYEQLSKGYEYGASKIYELVINNDPCYAYLMSSNPTVDQKMVMSHVYGHCDFFKNNYYFSFTNRKMMDEMANHATKVRRFVDQHGIEKVEDFLDLAQSIENLIDHMAPYVVRDGEVKEPESGENAEEDVPAKDYMQSFIHPPQTLAPDEQDADEQRGQGRKRAKRPVRDILSFLIKEAPLEDWQVEILEIIRSEAYYFNPQVMTKIMNEGWATYWHQKIMTKKVLNDAEILDYAETMSGAVSPNGRSLNPYQIGLALYHDIEERWNRGQHGLEYDRCEDSDRKANWDTQELAGRAKIFEARRHHCDLSFVDEFLTKDFCHKNRLFVYGWNPRSKRMEIQTRDFAAVKDQLLRQLANGGHPVIDVVDDNHDNKGELLLLHKWDQSDLKDADARATLVNLEKIWQRPVLIETHKGGKNVRYRVEQGQVEVSEV